jgi:hypothetical protein
MGMGVLGAERGGLMSSQKDRLITGPSSQARFVCDSVAQEIRLRGKNCVAGIRRAEYTDLLTHQSRKEAYRS